MYLSDHQRKRITMTSHSTMFTNPQTIRLASESKSGFTSVNLNLGCHFSGKEAASYLLFKGRPDENQVCAQLPTSADIVTLVVCLLLSAVLLLRTTEWGRTPRSIDISCSSGSQQQTRAASGSGR